MAARNRSTALTLVIGSGVRTISSRMRRPLTERAPRVAYRVIAEMWRGLPVRGFSINRRRLAWLSVIRSSRSGLITPIYLLAQLCVSSAPRRIFPLYLLCAEMVAFNSSAGIFL